jgi:hypothetical protein
MALAFRKSGFNWRNGQRMRMAEALPIQALVTQKGDLGIVNEKGLLVVLGDEDGVGWTVEGLE